MIDPVINVTRILTEVAAAAPDRPALISGGRQLSFSELDIAASATAALLAHKGVRRGDVLALLFGDPFSIAVTLMGAMRMGATPMVLAPSLTDSQRRDLIRPSGARFLVTSDPDAADQAIPVLRFALADLPRGDHRHLTDARPESYAEIMVGSGSTGRPLLMPISHRAVHARNEALAQGFELEPGGRLMLTPPLTFAATIRRFTATISRGITTIVFDPRAGLLPTIRAARPDVLHLTVLHAHKLLEEADAHPDFDLSELTQVSIGSSASSETLRAALRNRLKARLVINYGTNETGSATVAFPEDQDLVPDTVGRPHHAAGIQIVDPEDRPVEPGVVGLIRIRRPGMVDGYLDGAAPERFRDGWFYPGDLGRWEQGQLVHCGRADQMMIVDGINLYPAEIERCLARHPAVADVTAFPLPHRIHGDVPVCAVTLRPGSNARESDLTEFARRELGAKRPRRILITDSLPRTATGKPIRRELVRRMMEAEGLIPRPAGG